MKPKRKRSTDTELQPTGYMMVSPEWFEARLLGGVRGPNREAIKHYFAFLRAALEHKSNGAAHKALNGYEQARADALGLESPGDQWCGDVAPDHNGAPPATAPNWPAAPSLAALLGIVGPPSADGSGSGED